MNKKYFTKFFGLTLVAVLALTACGTQAPKEDPEVVLEKAITQAAKIYESTANISVNFKEPESKTAGDVSVVVSEKTNVEDIKDVHSEINVDVDADVDVPGQGNLLVKAAGNVKMIGDDVYAALTDLELDGDFEGLEQVNVMIPLVVGSYMNETVHLSLDKLMSINEQMYAGMPGAPTFDYDAIQEYAAEQMPKDLAESKMLVVSKDHGVEKVKSLGNSVQAYHYEINLDSKGFETFFKKYNEQFKMIPEDQMDLLFSEKAGQPGLSEIMEVVNEALDIQLWIGQEDYHVYKVEVGTDVERLKAAADKINEIDPKGGITAEELAALDKMDLDVSIVVESAPLKSFSLKKPSEDDVIDLGPMIDMALQGVMQQFPSPDDSFAFPEEAADSDLEEDAEDAADAETADNTVASTDADLPAELQKQLEEFMTLSKEVQGGQYSPEMVQKLTDASLKLSQEIQKYPELTPAQMIELTQMMQAAQ